VALAQARDDVAAERKQDRVLGHARSWDIDDEVFGNARRAIPQHGHPVGEKGGLRHVTQIEFGLFEQAMFQRRSSHTPHARPVSRKATGWGDGREAPLQN
jgi:hypothetical protein